MILQLRKVLHVRFAAFLLLSLSSAALLSCQALQNQPVFRPETPPRLEVPAGTVPIQGVPEPLNPNDVQNLTNPVPSTPESIKAGQIVFQTYCYMCHGPEGKGDGPVGKSFNPPPADLSASFMGLLSDGQIFGMITNGVGRMPPFGEDLTVQQRWEVINYVRTLQK